MSNIKQNEEKNDVSLIDTLKVIFPNIKSKYYDLLKNIIYNDIRMSSSKNEIVEYISGFSSDEKKTVDILNGKTITELYLMSHWTNFLNKYKVKDFLQFVEYNEKKLIEKNDITSYKTFDDILDQNFIAGLKETKKKLEKKIVLLYEDDTWLMIKPLTHDASVKYGYGAKWCTAMEHNSDYFIRYTENGILVYCINKKTNDKVAFHYELSENKPSFWDKNDKRIDSFQTGLPMELINRLFIDINDRLPNFDILRNKFGENNTLVREHTNRHLKNRPIDGLDVGQRPDEHLIDEIEVGQRPDEHLIDGLDVGQRPNDYIWLNPRYIRI